MRLQISHPCVSRAGLGKASLMDTLNTKDHRPGATVSRYGTEVLSPGSVHPLVRCSRSSSEITEVEHPSRNHSEVGCRILT